MAASLAAQTPEYKSSIGVSYSTLRFQPQEQYFGVGLDYRYMFRRSIGVQAEWSEAPERQVNYDARSGGYVTQGNVSALLGHRWGRVGLFGEAGFGWLGTTVLAGSNAQGTTIDYAVRNYPDLLLGGVLDVAVGRHWSLTYEVRDNLVFIGPYTQTSPPYTFVTTASQLNMPEGRVGVAFHFQQVKAGRQQHLSNVLAGSSSSIPQKKLRNSIGVSYSTLKVVPIANYNEQLYFGAGLEYTYMPRTWVGVQAQTSYFPQSHAYDTSISGGPMVQAGGSVLLGHRWGRVGIYGEGGFGVLRAHVFKGGGQQGFLYDFRTYPDLLMGGLVDVSLGRRWSATFNVRDNMAFVGTYAAIFQTGTIYTAVEEPAQQFHMPEVRAGVAFHF